jgi:hypothetical protein
MWVSEKLDWKGLMSNFCAPNILQAKYFKQVFSLKLFLKVDIKYVVFQKEQMEIYCLESSPMYRYMPSDLSTLDE